MVPLKRESMPALLQLRLSGVLAMIHASCMRVPGLLVFVAAGACSPLPPAQVSEAGLANDRSTILFISTRHAPAATLHEGSQIYLMQGDGSDVRRLTHTAHSNHFPALSPEGGRIVFDSYRLRRDDEPTNTSDLFLMNADGSGQTALTRGSSGTWSPDGTQIAFQASASGRGLPKKPYPGAVTSDSEIFVIPVNGLERTAARRNLTNSAAMVDEDPDWSPDGQRILFTSHANTDDGVVSETAEIYVMNADGTGRPIRLTNNSEEERAPSWSPDGARVAFMCRRSGADLEICVMNADGTQQVQLTNNEVGDLTPSWSPNGRKIVFHRPVARGRAGFQLWTLNIDGTGEVRLTNTVGQNAFANWSEVVAVAAR